MRRDELISKFEQASDTLKLSVEDAVALIGVGQPKEKVFRALDSVSIFPSDEIKEDDVMSDPVNFEHGVNGAAFGYLALSTQGAVRLQDHGKPSILVTKRDPDDHYEISSECRGIVVLHEINKHAVLDAEYLGQVLLCQSLDGGLKIEEDEAGLKLVMPDGQILREHDPMTINGGLKRLYPECVGIDPFVIEEDYKQLASLSDDVSEELGGMKILANVDTATEVSSAILSGAAGIGLSRSERAIRSLGNSAGTYARKILMLPKGDEDTGKDLFSLWEYLEVGCHICVTQITKMDPTIPYRFRLLDLFPADIIDVGDEKKYKKFEHIMTWIYGLEESDFESRLDEVLSSDFPRGVRFFKEFGFGLYINQIKGLFEHMEELDYEGVPEIMVPNPDTAEEVAVVKDIVQKIAGDRPFRFYAMIETMAAVENCGAIAELCDGISLGTNDLSFQAIGKREGTLSDPVKELMKKAVCNARRSANPDVEISVCGEQINLDVEAMRFCHEIGVSSLSVAPLERNILFARIMAAKLAAEEPRILGMTKDLDRGAGALNPDG